MASEKAAKTAVVTFRVEPQTKQALVDFALAVGSPVGTLLGVLFARVDSLSEDARRSVAARFTACHGLNLLARSKCDSEPARQVAYRQAADAQRRLALELIDAMFPDSADESDLNSAGAVAPSSGVAK